MGFVAPRHLFLHFGGGVGGGQDGARGGQGGAGESNLLTLPFIPGSESELQIALIALFSEMLYRFPNMVVAQVTRESVQQAIASGITAQQVSLRRLEVGQRGAVPVLRCKVFLLRKHSLRSVRGGGQSPGYPQSHEEKRSSSESVSLHCSQLPLLYSQ